MLSWPAASRADDDFLPPEKAFPATAAMADPNTVRVEFKVPKGYYMYRERFGFAVDPQEGATLGQARLPAGEMKYDPTFDKNMEVYHQPLAIDIPVHPAGPQPGDVTVVVTGQGCADAGICYPPMENRIKLRPINGGYQVAGPPVWGYASGIPGGDTAADAGQLAEAAPGVSLAPDAARPGLSRPSGLAQQAQVDTPPAAAGDGLGLARSGADAAGGGSPDRRTASPAGPASTGAPTATANTGFSALTGSDDVGLAGAIAGMGWLKTAGAFLLLGLLLSLTPCVLPMIPILSTIVIGRSGNGSTAVATAGGTSAPAPDRRPRRWTGLGLAAAYVLGMSVVYTILGIAAGLSGAGLAAWLQTPWVLTLFALLLALLALPMFDVYTFQMPASLQARMSDRASRIPGGRAAGALLMGAISALIVGPCVAAPLAGALLYISQTGDVLLGGSALFALAWGMGVPLLVVGASAGTLLPKAGAWMEGVKRFFGILLLATAWWMVVPIVPVALQMVGWAFLGIVGAVMLRAFEAIGPNAGAGRMFGKGLGLLLALVAVAQLVGAASGGRDVLQPLAHLAARGVAGGAGSTGLAGSNGASDGLANTTEPAFDRVRSLAELESRVATAGRPVMLDFYADWCVSCREMEKFTFSDPAVAARMRGMLLLRADVTANNADDRALLKRFKLFGPPGIMFFDAQGKELPQARVIGFQDAVRFGRSLDAVVPR
ncbi:protein-disulfide reductase DsbD [Achromobacter aloeverae]|uniref:Protein-disulfide reductase DsbD n=2 Tax=Achromobacter aloeverae TaxID=1750518 RepID=A0A4Q1HJG6_9BURK|nr:protein-disulfide reductase DsbD [Achromobacter aloeverae]